MNSKLNHKTLHADFCVVGGGLSGCFAALSAARHGAKVILMQDRPVLGGNASSEIRMWVRGAKGKFDRESGLISELEERNIRNNPTLVSSLFDATLYDMVQENPNITLLMNCSCADAAVEHGKILSVTGWQLTTYTWITVNAKLFADCSGDSILAPLVSARYRHGRESALETRESLAPKEGDKMTMGMSVLLAARETDHPVPFTPPSFANVYPDDECFSNGTAAHEHAELRSQKIATSGCNLWWIELGGDMHSIYDADKVRAELLSAVFGVWDHIKNRGDHGMENWDLEFVGFLPGKRESRRYVGDYVMNEHDVVRGGNFPDEVAFGGWPLDDHNPHGMRKVGEETHPSVTIPVPVYGIPYRALYSVNVENLMFAGRNISVTHAALSSTRVMATCSLIGQAVGTAAALALSKKCTPRYVAQKYVPLLQKELQDDGMFLPHIKNTYNKALLSAETNLTGAEKATLFNGVERPREKDGENGIVKAPGDVLEFSFETPVKIREVRFRFDPDFGRMSISDNKKMRVFAMKLHTGKDFVPVRVANTIVRDFTVVADGKEVARVEGNYLSNLRVPVHTTAKNLEIHLLATGGAEKITLYGLDIL